MKVLITESRIAELIGSYIDRNFPELNSLEQQLLFKRLSSFEQTQIGYVFKLNSSTIFMYEWCGEHYDDSGGEYECPELTMRGKYLDALVMVFGDELIKHIGDWFSKVYELPVSSVTFSL